MSDEVINLGDGAFEPQVLKSDIPALVDFWAPWCGPCRAIAPVLEELASDYAGKVKICKLNIDDYPQIAGQYSVRAIPTLLLFKGGAVVEQIVGLANRQKLEAALGKVL